MLCQQVPECIVGKLLKIAHAVRREHAKRGPGLVVKLHAFSAHRLFLVQVCSDCLGANAGRFNGGGELLLRDSELLSPIPNLIILIHVNARSTRTEALPIESYQAKQ